MNVIFAGKTFENTKQVSSHSHNCWEILYYMSGNGILKVGEEEIHFQPGDIICQPPNVPHSEFANECFSNIYIHVSDFRSPYFQTLSFRDNSTDDMNNIFTFLFREFHLKKENWDSIVDALFMVIYRYIASMIKEPYRNHYIKELENIMITNIPNPYFTIEEAQKTIPLSHFYMKRLFKKETGSTPIEYLTSKRIEYAQKLLETRHETSMSIKEIAGLSGYTDPYYFSRLFKKKTGKSPSDWLK